jgi:hypothetical protein
MNMYRVAQEAPVPVRRTKERAAFGQPFSCGLGYGAAAQIDS